ncbi:MAG: CRISPR-associated endoribonuclease Cas6 [Candidatus Hadarchaeota archaeon]
MRLLLRLRAAKDQAYDMKYHHKLQGFIYGLLEGTPYVKLHDRRGYKFFCFSNIFPSRGEKRDPSEDMKKGETRNLLISSPEVGLIAAMNDRLNQIGEEGALVNVGEMSFVLESVQVVEPMIGQSCRLITGTPIVLRIPRKRYEEYGIEPPKDYEYVYWRPGHPFEPFVKQLEDNLFKKYREFYGKGMEESSVFEQFEFRREVPARVVLKEGEVTYIGSLWEFSFGYLEGKLQELVGFGLDAGFGELNSLGFGFMNATRQTDGGRELGKLG